MATERIQIEVSETGSRVVRRNIEDIGASADIAQGAVSALKAMLATLAVGQIVKVADEYANMQNKIRAVSTSLLNASAITQRLYDVAARSQQSIEGVTEAYFTLDVALAKYGYTQEQVADAVETLSKAFSAFGTGTDAARLALVQLGQGFSKNRLETQDLKSVLQSAPPLIEILARNLNIAGYSSQQLQFKLLALAEEGKITGTVMMKAIQQMSGEINQKFDKSIVTIDRAMTVLSQNFKKAMGEMLLDSGATETVSKGLLSVANNMGLITGALEVIGPAIAFFTVATVGASAAMAVFNAIAAVNPFVLIATAIILGVSAIYKLTKAAKDSTDALKAEGTEANLLFDAQAKGLLGIAGLRQKAVQEEIDAAETLRQARKDASPEVDAQVQKFLENMQRESALILLVGEAYDVARAQMNAYKAKGAELTETEKKKIAEMAKVNSLLEKQKAAVEDITGPIRDYEDKMAGLNAALAAGQITLQQYTKAVDEANLAIARFRNQKTFSAGIEEDLKKEIELLKLQGDAYTVNRELLSLYKQKGSELTQEEKDRFGALIQNRLEMERYKSVVEGVQQPMRDYEQTTKALKAALDNGQISLRQYTLAMDEQRLALGRAKNAKTFEEQFVDDLNREIDALKQTGDQYTIAVGLLNLYKQKGSELTEGEREKYTALMQTKLEMERQKALLESITGPQTTFMQNTQALNQLFADGKITVDQYNASLDQMTLQYLQALPAAQTFTEGLTRQLQIMSLQTKNSMGILGTEIGKIFGPGGTLVDGIANAVSQSIVFGKSWKEQIRGVAQAILGQLIQAIVKMGLNMLLNQGLNAALGAASTAQGVAQAGALTAAYTPAAAMASLATGGTNAAAAGAGISSVFSILTSLIGGIGMFKDGGYTGPVGQNQVAGLVHGQEFVVNAHATRKHRATLEALNAGRDLGTQVVAPQAPPVNVSITNEIPDAAFEARALSETEIEIIARRVVRRDAPDVVANDLRNPNSRSSKAVTQNNQTSRRR